ncbi:phosphoenolpyruvate synthase [Enhygromyxa salina]|uniref:Phosphoenolpyruvate synthase n=1 Tax=Enhygromyxa salina TaxID=215803 RepID=A0A2S9XBA7_9BACT|nr:PEP-utilizing enzyme [Enhygromyxa salina]PRP90138.1 phosphoenolpyruvate synthase [Enhygromyxa salina]
MSFTIGEAPDRDDLGDYPKVARQHALAARGVRVPPGVVLDLARARAVLRATASERDEALAWVSEQFEAGHALIARSAGCREDREQTSGAGLGMSIPGLRDLSQLEGALAMIEAHGRTLVDVGNLNAERTLMLIQREVPRRALLVVVRGGEPGDRFYVEVHGPGAGPEPLAEGRSPDWAGPLGEWGDDSRAKVESLAAQVSASEGGPHGADLEIVVDPEGEAWLVQARPLTAALHPGWAAFSEAVAREGQQKHMRGSLLFDGEHNPAPLSRAHAWVMRRLGTLRPGRSGDPVILAGWLYVRVLPRELGAHSGEIMSVYDALAWLRDTALPQARVELASFAALLADQPPIRAALARAEALFLAMIDEYVGRLVPARKAALARTAGADYDPGTDAESETAPLSLRARAHFLDVLPAVWDIASPSLAELFDEVDDDEEEHALPESEAAAARLLGEWDDHLFACGLAPLRELWRYAGRRLDIDDARVFLLDGDELVALDEDALALGDADELERELRRRAELLAAQAQLDPPSRIIDGQPLPHPFGGRLRGLAIGEPFEGPIAQRRDLRDLLADPPVAGAVLCIPALTAQAAVALVRLGVRAVCTEYGGALAHGALMARELGLSALIGCHGCTRLAEGTIARVDTRARRLFASD